MTTIEKARLQKVLSAEGTQEHTRDAFEAMQTVAQQATGRAAGEKPEGVATALVTSRDPKKLVMYDENGRASYVSNNDLLGVSAVGLGSQRLYLECPACKGEHANPDDPNGCPDLPKKKYAACPRCGKRVYDDLAGLQTTVDGDDDPLRVQALAAFTSTPESRIKARLELHIATYHPRTARELGIVINPALMGA